MAVPREVLEGSNGPTGGRIVAILPWCAMSAAATAWNTRWARSSMRRSDG